MWSLSNGRASPALKEEGHEGESAKDRWVGGENQERVLG